MVFQNSIDHDKNDKNSFYLQKFILSIKHNTYFM